MLTQATANTTPPQNETQANPDPAGYERRQVIWPGTNELISVLMPLPERQPAMA